MSEEVNPTEIYPQTVVDEETNGLSEEQAIESEMKPQAEESSIEAAAIAEDTPNVEEDLSPSPVTEPEITVEALSNLAKEVETLRLQLEERNSQYMRIAADFDNFRKRTEREKGELELRVKRETLIELLPVIDSFDRARTQMKPQTEQEDSIHQSYQGVYKQLVDGLKRIGVAPMRAEGQPFDPNYHDAILREPTDQYPEGTVIEELRRGYLLGDLVLRHAMVKVSTEPEEASPSTPEAEPQEVTETEVN